MSSSGGLVSGPAVVLVLGDEGGISSTGVVLLAVAPGELEDADDAGKQPSGILPGSGAGASAGAGIVPATAAAAPSTFTSSTLMSTGGLFPTESSPV